MRSLVKEINESIDPLELVKDSIAYTFGSGLKGELDTYFKGTKKNIVEEKRFAKQQAKYDALTARGKEPDEKVIPAAIVDLDQVRRNILRQIDRLIEHYEARIANAENRNYGEEAIAMIDYLKSMASGVVHKVTHSMAKNKALKLMEEVGISDARIRFNQYPFEFSGGMRQRIVIAIALAADPDILICDEPTTALDVTIQAQILELINKIKAEKNLSVIFITHDLGVVANMADRIAVMYAGKIVELGTAEEIFYDPKHPYTWALLSSMPDLDTNEKLDAIPGTPPNMIFPPKGDAFAARNKYALKIDFEEQPPMFEVSETHTAATWLLHPDAPKVELPKTISDRIARMKQKAGGAENE
ncbi:MAG: ATP-binding cassette domain-containing protein [Clostridia bacterium]|nr:ATP-binding cassette domain-containing protein [Clostridia bacterium]